MRRAFTDTDQGAPDGRGAMADAASVHHLDRSATMRSSYRSRFANIGLALGAALVAAGCQSRPTPTPQPQPQPAATSLFVRNFTGREVAVYAVPKNDAKPVWLTNVPVDASRTVFVRWSDLQANGGLVVRTQIVGSSRTWTSDPLVIDEDIVGVLDLQAGAALTTAGSVLRGFTTQAFGAAMR
jgi:hypothetical protein